jgi:hypothetical protein
MSQKRISNGIEWNFQGFQSNCKLIQKNNESTNVLLLPKDPIGLNSVSDLNLTTLEYLEKFRKYTGYQGKHVNDIQIDNNLATTGQLPDCDDEEDGEDADITVKICIMQI